MENSPWRDATLLVLAHGSTVNSGSALPARHHAALLRSRRWFAAVESCFWQQEPLLGDAVAAARTPRVFIVPLFTGAGYFVEEVIPQSLGLATASGGPFPRVWRRGDSTCYYAHPVGTHAGMTEVLLARAREVVAKHPFPRAPKPSETALVIAGHGTARSGASRLAVEREVERIRERALYAEVHAAFLEESPRVADCAGAASVRHLVIVPFFVSDGLHVVEDIPVLLGEPEAKVQDRLRAGLPPWRNPTERHGKRIWYAPGLGEEPLLTGVILQRVEEAAAWTGGTTGTADR